MSCDESTVVFQLDNLQRGGGGGSAKMGGGLKNYYLQK